MSSDDGERARAVLLAEAVEVGLNPDRWAMIEVALSVFVFGVGVMIGVEL